VDGTRYEELPGIEFFLEKGLYHLDPKSKKRILTPYLKMMCFAFCVAAILLGIFRALVSTERGVQRGP
jgi:hypothetical protein